jgi:methylthioribose-1-phosphate isomerase
MMKPLEWRNGTLRFLDQTKLPAEEVFIETDDVLVVVDAIKRLALRGAPLIGIAAAYGVALCARKCSASSNYLQSLEESISLLAETRPTAINIFWALKRQKQIIAENKSQPAVSIAQKLIDEALSIHREDVEMCELISAYGANLISTSSTILTHCNAGALATGGRGTALGVITKAWELGKCSHVFVDETRPLLQGARLTAWELKQANIPFTLITDNTAAFAMQQRKISAVVVGADRIACNGDIANKIGTYNVAVLAKHHHIPFYVAAPVSTIDFSITSGKEIPIEERSADETTIIAGKRITPEGVKVYSPAFDITPNERITAIVTDRGVIRAPYRAAILSLKSLHAR